MTNDKNDELDYIRHWSERAYDRAQLAQIAAIEEHIIAYAMTAWRPMEIVPPPDQLLICTVEETPRVALMRKTAWGDWRTSGGQPHRPPSAWMPCPPPNDDAGSDK